MRTEFLDKLCPVCRKAFSQGDDIVVCPVCGAPHHRECYARENKCGVEEFHASGYVWNGFLPGEEIQIPVINVETSENNDLNSDTNAENEKQQPSGFDPFIAEFIVGLGDETVGNDGVSMRELMTFTSKSLYHYGQAFGAFRGEKGIKKKKTFFNICSGLLAPMHQFYRKMDVLGVAVMILMLLPSLLIALNESFFVGNSSAYYFFNILSIAEEIALCIFGDYLYYRHAVKKIKKIRAEYKDNYKSEEYYAALSEAGRPSILRAIVGTLIFALLTSLILILPQYI